MTIAIVTRDREDELRRAVRSALAQEGAVEVLVVDDGSRDGTPEMLRAEFPDVRVVRFDDDAGVAARRNDVAKLATAEVIVSIDDDAVLPSARIVCDLLADFDHPRIAVVAMPYVDVGVSPEVQQRAPDTDGCWITTIFRATAYAIRRDALLGLGGYDPEIDQFGEEWELSLRLVDAGHLIRLGRSEPIDHQASPKRDWRRMDLIQHRNEQLICWSYFPFPWNLVYMAGYALRGVATGVRVGRAANHCAGVVEGLRLCATGARRRRPISRAAFRFDQLARSRLRAGSAVRLAEAQAALGPTASSGARRWPAPLRPLHGPLRSVRTWLINRIGRPIHCELCGEELFRGLPVIWRGRLQLFGAESARVRADWDKMNRMAFRHVERDRCSVSPVPANAGRRAVGGRRHTADQQPRDR